MRLGRTAAAAVVGMAVLTACSDGGTANETLPPISSSAAPTTAALPPLGPSDFPIPVEAREKSEAGALAAGRYFLQLTVHAYQKGDTESVVSLSRDCEYCETLILGIREDVGAGNRVTGGDIVLEDPGQVSLKDDQSEVAFTVSQSALAVSGPDGQPLPERAQPSFRVFTSVVATWSESLRAWIVNQVTIS
jgi:hypothetical protein